MAPRIAIDARKRRDFGIGSYLTSLLEGLRASDASERFLVALDPRDPPPFEDPRFEWIPCGARPYGLAEHVQLPLVFHRRGADLLHVPHYVLPFAWRRPSIVTIHDLIHLRFPEYLPSRAAHFYAKRMIADAYSRADRVLTVSEFSRADLLDTFGGAPERVRVLPNRIAAPFLRAPSDEELARARAELDLPERFVLHVGNHKPHKNVDLLVEALERLRREPRHNDVHLVFAGGTPEPATLARARDVGLPVHALGRLKTDRLIALLRLASVFAFPSLYEGFGLPVLEAMAQGTPVVAARAASLPEICGTAALLADPREVDEWVTDLGRVLDEPALRDELAESGRTRATAFSSDESVRRTLSIYREVLGA